MLTERTFTVTHTGCGEATTVAMVDIDATRLSATVTGTITGADGSMTAELERVAYDEETDELGVRVTTTERSGDTFPQCLTEVDYEAGPSSPRHSRDGSSSSTEAWTACARSPAPLPDGRVPCSPGVILSPSLLPPRRSSRSGYASGPPPCCHR